MKAILSSIREGVQRTETMHTILLMWRDATKVESVGNDALQRALLTAGIAVGTTDYQTTINIASLFKEAATINGVYSPEKAYALACEAFKVGTPIDNANFNLFEIPLSEIDPTISVLYTQDGRTFTSYRRAGYFTREQLIEQLRGSLAASLATGALIRAKQPEQQPKPAAVNLQSALLNAATEEGV